VNSSVVYLSNLRLKRLNSLKILEKLSVFGSAKAAILHLRVNQAMFSDITTYNPHFLLQNISTLPLKHPLDQHPIISF